MVTLPNFALQTTRGLLAGTSLRCGPLLLKAPTHTRRRLERRRMAGGLTRHEGKGRVISTNRDLGKSGGWRRKKDGRMSIGES